MKRIFLLCLFLASSLISCIAEKKTPAEIKLGVISDLHYLSSELMDGGEATNMYVKSTGRNIVAMPEILDKVIEEYLASDIECLLIPGDLTKDGEKLSHEELIKILKPLQDKGIRIYVVPGNHDVNIPNAKGFKNSETFATSSITDKEFETLYASFGYGSAFAKDTSSLSYATVLSDDIWLIAIDAIKYEDYTTSSITAGRIKPETEAWIIQMLEKAKQKKKTVIGMMHHGMVEHIIHQDTFFSQYLVDDWKRLAPLFADGGMKAIFTGHFHATDITKFTSPNQSTIYDIETGALCSYPFAYRFISLSANGIDIKTRNIQSTTNYPQLSEDSKNTLWRIAQNMTKQKIRSKGFEFSDKLVNNLSELAGYVFLEHVMGDETLDGNITTTINTLAKELDLPIDTENNTLELDFYPPDNNIKIEFD